MKNFARRILPAVLALAALSCGNELPPTAAQLGWTLNYRDWTKVNCVDEQTSFCTNDDFRACDNKPLFNAGPTYDAIDKVRINLKDPDGQVPPFDTEFECEQGMDSTKAPIRGITMQSYTLTMEAKAADGTVLYRYIEEEFDLSSSRSEVFELGAATGELNFSPSYAGSDSGSCPSDADTLRYTFSKSGEDEPVLTGTTSACDDTLTQELFLRKIPTAPTPGRNDSFALDNYSLRLEGLSGTDVVYCSDSVRPVGPGDNNFRQNQTLSSGECL